MRQGGFGLIELAIWGGVAVVAMGAVYGVDKSRQNIGAAKQVAKYAPVIEQCKAMGNEDPAKCAVAIRTVVDNNRTCEAANKSLDDQFAAFRKQHNEEIEAAHAEYKNAQARKAQAKTEAGPKIAELAIEKFNLIVASGKAGLTCEQMDEALLLEAERRQRFYGAATPAQQRAPADGGVRIVAPAPTPSVRPPAVNPLRPK